MAALCSLAVHGAAVALLLALSLRRLQSPDAPVAVAMVFEQAQPVPPVPPGAPVTTAPPEPSAATAPAPAELPPPPQAATVPDDPAVPSPPELAEPSPPAAAAVPEQRAPVPPREARRVIRRARSPARPTAPAQQPPRSRVVLRQAAAASPASASSMPQLPGPSLTRAPAMVSAGWRSALAAWLQRHRRYPEAAEERSEQGTAIVRLTVRRDGQVVSVNLVRSSGSAILDAAAQAMLSGGRLPAFSADMPQDQISLTVPISYRLDQ